MTNHNKRALEKITKFLSEISVGKDFAIRKMREKENINKNSNTITNLMRGNFDVEHVSNGTWRKRS